MTRHILLLALVFLFAGVASAQSSERGLDLRQSLAHSRLVDLTYSYDENTIYWPTAEGFKWTKDQWGPTPGGYFYASASYGGSEHGGTHLDSPLHFAEGHEGTDEIPVTRLIAPAVVIDVAAACDKNSDYLFSADDITRWEQTHGRIPEGAIVLVRTGWGKYWPERKRYLGTDERGAGAVPKLHFPGISAEAARVMVSRKVFGAGIDTASVDYGQSKDFQTHRILYAENIYGLENVANLDQLPATGTLLIALPMKIKGGTGGPVRIVAVVPEAAGK
jgi:kynurenine formamidase